MIKNKESFTVNIDGKDMEISVVKPDVETMRKGQMEFNRVFNDAIKSEAPLRKFLGKLLIEKGVWSAEKQLKLIEMQTSMVEDISKLKNGGMKLSEGRKLAIKINQARNEIRQLISEQAEMDSLTAEGQGENARFNYYVFACTFKDDGELYFASLDDYYRRYDEGDEVAVRAAYILADLMAGLNKNDDNLPENQFLKKYKFIDKEGRFVNKDGKFVDADGNLVNENGERVNENNELIDNEGNVINKVEPQPFIDDDGNSV